MYKQSKINGGYIAFTSTLIISAITLAVVISVSLLGVDELKSSLAYVKGEEALSAAYTCMDEAYLRIAKEDHYTGGTLPVPGVQCSINVTGVVPDLVIEVTGKDKSSQYVKRIRSHIKKSGTAIRVMDYVEF